MVLEVGIAVAVVAALVENHIMITIAAAVAVVENIVVTIAVAVAVVDRQRDDQQAIAVGPLNAAHGLGDCAHSTSPSGPYILGLETESNDNHQDEDNHA